MQPQHLLRLDFGLRLNKFDTDSLRIKKSLKVDKKEHIKETKGNSPRKDTEIVDSTSKSEIIIVNPHNGLLKDKQGSFSSLDDTYRVNKEEENGVHIA